MREIIKKLTNRSPKLYYFLKRKETAAKYYFKRVHDMDFYFFKNFYSIKQGLFIDIGANSGQSAISFSIVNKSWKIISFEPNKYLEKDLKSVKKILGDRYNYNLYGIGEENFKRPFYIPQKGNSLITGEGTFVKDELFEEVTTCRLGKEFNIKEFEFEVKNFDKLNLEPDIIKIDTQGYEISVLKGMINTLGKYHPILMIEKTANLSEKQKIEDLLKLYGYEIYCYDYKNNILKQNFDEADNFFAVPNSKDANTKLFYIYSGIIKK